MVWVVDYDDCAVAVIYSASSLHWTWPDVGLSLVHLQLFDLLDCDAAVVAVSSLLKFLFPSLHYRKNSPNYQSQKLELCYHSTNIPPNYRHYYC